MAYKYKDMVDQVVELVGGPENVSSAYHCITRLRFRVKDEGKVDLERLSEVEGALSAVNSAGQIQVIVGQHVGDVYDEMQELYHFAADTSLDPDSAELEDAASFKGEMADKKLSIGVIDFISGLFTPILGIMTATGLIKGICTLLSALGVISATDGAYVVMYAMGDCFFNFLPIFLGYTAMKKLGGTPALGALIGAALVYPSLADASSGEVIYTLFEGTLFASPVYLEFFGLPIVMTSSYESTVIPIICICAVAAPLERWLAKHIPVSFKMFVVPACTLFVSAVLGLVVIGPIVSVLSNLLGAAITAIYTMAPAIAGLAYGAFIQVCVIFGVHYGFVAVAINNMATMGYDPITICGLASAFGQAGVVLAIWMRTKNQRVKSVALPSFFSAMVGITEPAIYGITLQRKKAFAIACVASGIAGAIIGGAGVKCYSMGIGGVFGWMQAIPPTGFDSTVLASVIACVVAFAISLGLTLALWKRLDIE